MAECTRDSIRLLAGELLANIRRIDSLRSSLERLCQRVDQIPSQMVKVLGKTAACLLWTILGDPRHYHCGAAWLKAMGLNLVEHSSGQYKGQVHISKRGSSEVRKILYHAGLRLIQQRGIKEWYERKKKGRRGKNGRETGRPALIAVIRKVLRGLYQAIRNEEDFDAKRLFFVERKSLERVRIKAGVLPVVKTESQREVISVIQKEEQVETWKRRE